MKKYILLLLITLIISCSKEKSAEKPVIESNPTIKDSFDLTITSVEGVPDNQIGIEVLKIAYSKLDLKVNFVEYPGVRALIMSSSGEVGGEAQRIHSLSDKHPTLIRVPTPIGYFEPSVFVIKGNPADIDSSKGWLSLKDKSVVYTRGMKYAEDNLNGITDKITDLNYDLELLISIKEKKADAAIIARYNGLYISYNEGIGNIYPLSPPIEKIYIYHYLHEKHKDLVPAIDAVLKEMDKAGNIYKIREEAMAKLLGYPEDIHLKGFSSDKRVPIDR